MKENNVSMLIAGDLLPTKTNEFEFMNAEVEKLFGKEFIYE